MRPNIAKYKELGQRRCSDSFFAPWFTLEQSQRRLSENSKNFDFGLIWNWNLKKAKSKNRDFRGIFCQNSENSESSSGLRDSLEAFIVDKLSNEYFGVDWQAREVVWWNCVVSVYFGVMHLDLMVRKPSIREISKTGIRWFRPFRWGQNSARIGAIELKI